LAGREPVERDTLYNVVPDRTPEPPVIPLAPAAAPTLRRVELVADRPN
jgi:hypothetical protein